MAIHIAQKGRWKGQAVNCNAEIQCTLKEKDGSPSPHFETKEEGNNWIQNRNAAESNGSHLQGTSKPDATIAATPPAPAPTNSDAGPQFPKGMKWERQPKLAGLENPQYAQAWIHESIVKGYKPAEVVRYVEGAGKQLSAHADPKIQARGEAITDTVNFFVMSGGIQKATEARAAVVSESTKVQVGVGITKDRPYRKNPDIGYMSDPLYAEQWVDRRLREGDATPRQLIDEYTRGMNSYIRRPRDLNEREMEGVKQLKAALEEAKKNPDKFGSGPAEIDPRNLEIGSKFSFPAYRPGTTYTLLEMKDLGESGILVTYKSSSGKRDTGVIGKNDKLFGR